MDWQCLLDCGVERLSLRCGAPEFAVAELRVNTEWHRADGLESRSLMHYGVEWQTGYMVWSGRAYGVEWGSSQCGVAVSFWHGMVELITLRFGCGLAELEVEVQLTGILPGVRELTV